MEFIQFWIDFILHIDKHLDMMVTTMGIWTYIILFAIVFAETGLVVTPFLPGDSLLFATGALCATGSLDLTVIIVSLIIAAIIGDALNYWIGKRFGTGIFSSGKIRWLNMKHIERTHEFYERHGGKTIIMARFIPIIRTFAPFVAGIGNMGYSRFATYNVVGAVVWIISFTVLGYFFANQPIIKKNFSLVILGIIVISVMPAVIEFFRQRRAMKRTSTTP
ncbi:MAG: DedA family protein [Candidatus Kapabacteria bacterium]|nr:DedA family protein [Candidatus Kapabacteria bacterium]